MDIKLSELLRATLAKTEARLLTWEAFDEESYRVRIGTGALHLQRETRHGDDVSFVDVVYSVQVSDRVGRVVLETEVLEGQAGFKLCDDLFLAAKKNTSDRILEEMLDALGTPRRAS